MRKLKLTLAYLLQDSGFDWEVIEEYLDDLTIEIELVKLPQVLGFAIDKVYIDFLNIYHIAKRQKCKGHLPLYVLLHEIGHMLRITGDDELKAILEGDDFEVYFNSVLEEEEAVHDYALKIFKELTGEDVSEVILNGQPDIHSDNYRHVMLQTFEGKIALGGWDKFIDKMVDRDYEWRTKEISWNTMYEEEERMVRCCINGDFYNPFKDKDLFKDKVSYNPFTFEAIKLNGESLDDYNEKDVVMMNPFNSRYTTKASYENGKVVEAYMAEDNQWVPIDLETLNKE